MLIKNSCVRVAVARDGDAFELGYKLPPALGERFVRLLAFFLYRFDTAVSSYEYSPNRFGIETCEEGGVHRHQPCSFRYEWSAY
ncbi:hypothetical protein RRSWK_04091 [Rhodopirellula sp. SWK7]|nr:hypothetical protein RRSWK_04091 [Rhodopirellula sp. SWK7]